MEFVFTPPLTSSEGSGNAKNTSSQVSDTGVMRILGDMSAESVEREEPSVATRPCTRCGVSIPEHVAVCTSCKCYVGILPSFYQQLGGDQATGTHLR